MLQGSVESSTCARAPRLLRARSKSAKQQLKPRRGGPYAVPPLLSRAAFCSISSCGRALCVHQRGVHACVPAPVCACARARALYRAASARLLAAIRPKPAETVSLSWRV